MLDTVATNSPDLNRIDRGTHFIPSPQGYFVRSSANE